MAKIAKPPYFEDVVNAGEERLMNFLEVNLPESYVLIPNLEISSTNPKNDHTQTWEYDLVVVTPHAIYNIENKDWRGRIEGDDNYWYQNDRQKRNPLKTGRIKTAILSSKLKEQKYKWGKAWVQNMVTLSYPNSQAPLLDSDSKKVTYQLDEDLIDYIMDPLLVNKYGDEIDNIKDDIVQYLIGNQSKKKAADKKELLGYEVLEVISQDETSVEYLVKPKGGSSNIRKKIKENHLQVRGLSLMELEKRELQIKNGKKALEKINSNPFIANVQYHLDDENHLFYEITDFLDEDSLHSVARSKTFTFQEKISVIKNLMSALKAAHSENVYHRDINPNNIFISGGYAMLGNFGNSYFLDHHEEGYTVHATLNEQSATAYHPHELLIKDSNRSSDIYSLVVLIYWIFTDQEPIKSPYELDRIGGKLTPNRLPTAILPSLPEWLDTLCLKNIIVDDTKRMDDIEELETFLEEVLYKETSSATPKKPEKKQEIPPNTYEVKEGDRIGDYTVHSQLGKGGYSRVFKVKHSLQGKDYALKLFHESVNINSVLDEYKALKELSHPHIVKFVWNGTTPNGQFYTLTEYLKGDNLSNYVRTELKLPIYRVYQLGEQILSALNSMQSGDKLLLHRDIKPQNIIWDDEERFVLIDFNVASHIEGNTDFVGTNPYLAPDLIRENMKVDWEPSADTFALGITLYELICKSYPWTPGRMPLMSQNPRNPKEFEPRISTAFSNFLLKAISTDKGQRFSSAKNMLEALEKIGIENILEPIRSTGISSEEVQGNKLDKNFLTYINSLYSQSKYGNSGTRANINISEYDKLTYTPTRLDSSLIPAVLDGQYKLLIITGNAGDGKTAFIRKIEGAEDISEVRQIDNKNGAHFKINGIPFQSNYDGSQDEDEKVNNQVLEEFFQPFENLEEYGKAKEGRIIAINEGRLVEFLSTSNKHNKLAKTISEYFYQEGHHELPEGLMIINLNLRSVTAQDENGDSLFRKQIKTLTDKNHWSKCSNCSLSNQCFIKYNVESFNDSSAGESVISRMEWLIRTASLKRELHITMRDLRSLIAYTITRDYRCEDIPILLEQTKENPEEYWKNYYFNITDTDTGSSGQQDRLIRLLRETDMGEVAIPDLDRDLYFRQHESKEYLEFNERENNLLETFNKNKIFVPAHEQNEQISQRLKNIHKSFIRHQYFEGKSDLINIDNANIKLSSERNPENWMPSYLLRLPYHAVYKFIQVLKRGDENNHIKESISRAISLNEGCDNNKIDKNYLVLASTEVKDPFSKSFRLFALDDFELFVNRTNHLVNYLEYEPDSLIFRHRDKNHIQLTISLDLYEMLYFIQKGFSPSLNDLRGKFVELIIFKNLLENLNYNAVVVTSDNLEFFKISKENQNKLSIQPMNI